MIVYPDYVAIIVQDFNGHRLGYVRRIVDEALARGAKPIVVAVTGTKTSDEYGTHLAEVAGTVSVTEVEELTLTSVKHALPSIFDGPLIFPDGDRWLGLLARARAPWTGGSRVLVMRPTGQSTSGLTRALQTVMKKMLRRVVGCRPGIDVFTLASSATAHLGAREVRDPVTFAAAPERIADMRRAWAEDAEPANIYWFGVIGALGARKNIDIIASAVASIDQPNIGLALLGRATPDEEAMTAWTACLRKSGGRYFRDSRQLSDEDFDAAVAALDCVILAHSNEGPSGVFGKARAAGTRVIAAGAKSLKRDARLAPDLATWVPLEEATLTRALADAVGMPAPGPSAPESASFARRLIQGA